MKRILFYLPVLICFLFNFSCDNSPEGGNAKTFGTVYLYVEYPTTIYDADIQVRIDTNSDTICDSTGVFNDDITLKVMSTAHESLPSTVKGSTVKIQEAYFFIK